MSNDLKAFIVEKISAKDKELKELDEQIAKKAGILLDVMGY